ncbi:MAG TPA: 50S ribosomal protein L13 [Thermomicrobiales bacterium]|nr:50S ribosomal protein L13 [Thermomicrobiales bacterium]
MATRTFVPRQADIERKWFVVDAEGQTLGRLATHISTILRGKHKPMYTPHLDVGDYVVVINAEKIEVSGGKADQKTYYRHSGYPGGIHQTVYSDLLAKHPERVLEAAVRGMLPHTNLGRQQFTKLKVYAGPTHPHAAQQPAKLEFKSAARP